MKTKRNLQWIILGLGLLNLILVALLFFGGSPFSKKHSMREHQGKRIQNKIIDQLQFEQEQILDYEQLINEHRQSIKFHEDQMHQAQAALFQSFKSPDFKVKQDSIIQQIAAAQVGIQQAHINHFEALRKLCKPTQMDQFEILCDELHQLFGQRQKPHFRPKKRP